MENAGAEATGVTQELADWLAALRYGALPPAVAHEAKRAVIDSLGVAVFVGGTKPWGRTLAAFAARDGGGRPESTVLTTGAKAMASRAALANGTMALGFEFEDALVRVSVRPSVMTVPVALALGEARHRSGQELLAAVVAGYEAMLRISLAIPPDLRQDAIDKGFYYQGLVGGLGSVVAAGRVIGLSAAELTNALGVAGSFTAGLFQGHEEGAWTRSLNAGMAGERGVTAALLAESGFVAPKQILEGVAGFYKVFADGQFDPAALLDGLGESFAMSEIWHKAYPANASIHAPVEALFAIMRSQDIAPEDVAEIVARWHMYRPFLRREQVPSIVSAQASLPFALAVACVRGRVTVDEFGEEVLGDPEVVAMVDRVRVEPDLGLHEQVDRHSLPGVVTIVTKDGRRYTETVQYPKGHWKNPLTDAELEAKFLDLTTRVLPKAQCAELYQRLMDLDQVADVASLSALWGPPQS